MVQRVALSVVLVPLLIAAVKIECCNGLVFLLFVLALSVLSAREFFSLLVRPASPSRPRWWPCCLPQAVCIILHYLNYFLTARYLGILYTAGYTCAAQAICGAFFYPGGTPGRRTLFSLAGYVYTGLFPLALFTVRAVFRPPHVYLLFLLAWTSDAAAYLVGIRFGKKRGVVRWSPQKSLEGYVAAFVITVGAAAAAGLVFPDQFGPGVWRAVIFGVAVAVTAPAGDIVESAIKRKAQKKDSARLLPGFGGVLDIFDSVLLSAPVYLLFLFLL